MKAVVLSNQSQFEAFLKEGFSPSEFKIFCDNARFYEALSSRASSFDPLDEFLFVSRWPEINVWACSAATEWIRVSRELQLFKTVEVPSAVYHLFSRMLVQMIKNYLYAEYILEHTHPEALVSFRPAQVRHYPEFSGNFYLNYFLEQLAAEKKIPFRRIAVDEEEIKQGVLPDYDSKVKVFIKRQARKFLQKVYGLLTRPGRKIEVMVYGSQKHLSGVMETLKRRGVPLAFYDFEYHPQLHRYARGRQIPYWIPECFSEAPSRTAETENWADERLREIVRSLEAARESGLFHFEGRDFTDFIKNQIFLPMKGYLKKTAETLSVYEKIFKLPGLKALLVEEDYAQRGSWFAALAKTRGIQVFCVSHANPVRDFTVPPENRLFSQSVTFVNSEFERDMYEGRGWSAQNIVVSGTPRYDRLFAIKKHISGDSPLGSVPFRLLYIATSLWLHSPDQRGFMGSKVKLYGDIQVPALREILTAAARLPVEFVIKPHSYQQVPSYKQFIEKEKPVCRIRITSHDEDIFKLYQECDAAILSYWSNAIFETALFGLPTIFVDWKPPYGRTVYEFQKQGMLIVVRSADEIIGAVQDLIQSREEGKQFKATSKEAEYYLGKRDSGATERVTAHIQNFLHRPSVLTAASQVQCSR